MKKQTALAVLTGLTCSVGVADELNDEIDAVFSGIDARNEPGCADHENPGNSKTHFHIETNHSWNGSY
jgi:hypothetical protein